MAIARVGAVSSGGGARGGPFDLDDEASHRVWRDAKLERYPARAEDFVVDIRDPSRLHASERAAVAERCGRANAARKRNIAWRDDEPTRRAAAALGEVLETDPLVLRVRMRPGRGLICNNVLDDRTGFVSSATAGRLLFRIGYDNRIDPDAR
jgi:hypothetical protein